MPERKINLSQTYFDGKGNKTLEELTIEQFEKEEKRIEQDHLEKANALYEKKKKEDGPIDWNSDITKKQFENFGLNVADFKGGDRLSLSICNYFL